MSTHRLWLNGRARHPSERGHVLPFREESLVTHEHPARPSRRRALQQMGVGAAVAWTVPVLAAAPAVAFGTPAPGCPLCPQVTGWSVGGNHTSPAPGVYELAGDGVGTLALAVTYDDPGCGPAMLSISAAVAFLGGDVGQVDLSVATRGDSAFVADWNGGVAPQSPVLFVAAPPTATEPSFLELFFQTTAADPIVISDIAAVCASG